MENKEYLEFAKEIAYEAGKIMLKYFNAKDISSYKGDKTIVTLADKEINTYLINRVKEKFPDHCVDGEEEKFGNSNYVWVCDPIDGTAMYARHIPVAVFSLALVVDGESKVGVVYDVFTDTLYSAIKGEGAYKNGEKISVNIYKLEDMRSVSNYDMWPEAEYKIYDIIKEIGNKTYFVSIGSVIRGAMCVASGEFNLAIFPGTKRKNWGDCRNVRTPQEGFQRYQYKQLLSKLQKCRFNLYECQQWQKRNDSGKNRNNP